MKDSVSLRKGKQNLPKLKCKENKQKGKTNLRNLGQLHKVYHNIIGQHEGEEKQKGTGDISETIMTKIFPN